MTFYREGMLRPTNCTECACEQARWNGGSCALRTDPPETCRCGHPFFRHRFQKAEKTGEYPS